ncbi:MAG: dipeptidase [Spirochaetes bacterium]|nr:MAG: dipeptidase [Spirochaetota bacterium]
MKLMIDIKSYFETNRNEILRQYFDFLRIPSISTGKTHSEECRQAASFVLERLKAMNCDTARLIETDGNPLVFGELNRNSTFPTVLIYGHYDVMPADITDGWNTDPFEPVLSDGVVFARGAEDNKGQVFFLLKTVEYLVENERLNCNIKWMIEGEEECGSSSLWAFLDSDADALRADICLVCDTDMIDIDTPAIVTSLRGAAIWDITVQGPRQDLHSGLYGGAVVNPVKELVRVLGSLFSTDGKVLLPGFYDEVRQYTPEERIEITQQPFDEEEIKKIAEVESLGGEVGFSALERIVIRPTLEITGISGGYTDEGLKAIVPSYAKAKVFARLVMDQNPSKIKDSLVQYFQKNLTKGVQFECEKEIGLSGYVCNTDSRFFTHMNEVSKQIFGKTPAQIREGGSIPVVAAFKEKLGMDSLLMGFGLRTDNIHGPNEHFSLENMVKGMETIAAFFQQI